RHLDVVSLSIGGINKKTRRLESMKEALATYLSGPVPHVESYAAAVAEATPPADEPSPTFLIAYSGSTRFDGVGGHYLVARLMPDQKKEDYRTDKLGNFLPKVPGVPSPGVPEELTRQLRGMGLIDPEHLSLLRRVGKKAPLFLVGSNHTQMWSMTSSD